ncbi:MAG TPA: hypothetical protein VK714_06010 [Myxococcota bacterium]|nr:hypothetical protein [Myxococcota bacterium]
MRPELRISAASTMAPLPHAMVEQIKLGGDTVYECACEEHRAARRCVELGWRRVGASDSGGS